MAEVTLGAGENEPGLTILHILGSPNIWTHKDASEYDPGLAQICIATSFWRRNTDCEGLHVDSKKLRIIGKAA